MEPFFILVLTPTSLYFRGTKHAPAITEREKKDHRKRLKAKSTEGERGFIIRIGTYIQYNAIQH